MYWPARYVGNGESSRATRRKRERLGESLCHSTIRPDFKSAMASSPGTNTARRCKDDLGGRVIRFVRVTDKAHAMARPEGRSEDTPCELSTFSMLASMDANGN